MRTVLAGVLLSMLAVAGCSTSKAESQAVAGYDFGKIDKIAIVEKEAAETQYWLDLLLESGLAPQQKCRETVEEATELLAIFTSVGRTAKRNNSKR